MKRLLIADGAEEFANAIVRQLKDVYTIEVCGDADKVADLVHSFEPDILLLDLMLSGGDGVGVLHALRTSGSAIPVVVTGTSLPVYVLNTLEKLCVSRVFRKPCKVSEIAACIHDISTGSGELADWFVESEIDSILLRLGFSMGPARYSCVYHGVLHWYRCADGLVTKQLYPEVARVCGGSTARVEKAIRDAVHDAWKHGDRHVWQLYFPPGKGGVMNCPSNEVFIARIAAALHHRARLRKPAEAPLYKVL